MKGKIILLVTTAVICIVLAEIILRAMGMYATYLERTDTGGYVSPFDVAYGGSWYRVHPPNEKVHYANNEFSESWVTNNEGFDDKNFLTTDTSKKIIVIGDSFTEGSGAVNDSSYPSQLRYIIDSTLPGTEVWNCGVGGSDLFFEYVLFRDKLLKYKPEMLIVTVNNTDIYETMVRGGFERFGKDGKTHYRKGPWFEPLFAHSRLVRGIVLDVCHYDWSFTQKGQEQQLHDSAIAEMCYALDSFNVLCKAEHVQLLFVFHPMQNELEKKEKYFAGPQMAYCREKGYGYIDTREAFYKMGIDTANAGSLYWPVDGHFNNKGYNYLARSVWKKISGQLAP